VARSAPLGRPVANVASASGILVSASPNTYDDAGVLPPLADVGTAITRAVETYDDSSVFKSVTEHGTLVTRSNTETYDDDSVLPLI
jgi:hypothetical protein